jgi:alanine dehydrogenase
MNGLNVCQGQITHQAVAHDLHMSHVPAEKALAA